MVKNNCKIRRYEIRLGLNNAIILPNGVDLNLFRPLNKNEYRQNLGLDLDKKYILFAFNPACPKKTLL